VAFSQFDGFSGGSPVELSGSTGSGLRSDDTTDTPVSVSLERVRIVGNGAAGVFLNQMPGGSAFSIRSSQVEGNAGSSYSSPTRTGGGVVVVSPVVPSLTFKGNRVWGNVGDQVGLFLPADTGTPLDLSGGDPLIACDDPANLAAANVLGCGSGKDVFSTTTETFASAVRNYWKAVPNVTAVDADDACAWAAPLCP
jgi:hypothetical protein